MHADFGNKVEKAHGWFMYGYTGVVMKTWLFHLIDEVLLVQDTEVEIQKLQIYIFVAD